jgi:hypothetical protein
VPDADDAARLVGSLLEPDGPAVAPEEAFWAVRKVLEALSRRRPLVLVVDDLHWAEPTFIDLVEHVADWARDAPLLVLIMARPELLDTRPGWGGGKPNATSVLLEPLGDADAADLLWHLRRDPSRGIGASRYRYLLLSTRRQESARHSTCAIAGAPGRARGSPGIRGFPTACAELVGGRPGGVPSFAMELSANDEVSRCCTSEHGHGDW